MLNFFDSIDRCIFFVLFIAPIRLPRGITHGGQRAAVHNPVELPGILVKTGKEDTQGVEKPRSPHWPPSGHPKDDLAESNLFLHILDAGMGFGDVRHVI